MEYFLYAFGDAHRIMQELQKYGGVIKQAEEEIQRCGQEEAAARERLALAQASGGLSAGGNPELAAAKAQLTAEAAAARARRGTLERQVDDIRYQMAQRETELLLVFGELMRYDIFAPDHYFDGDRLLHQGRANELLGGAGAGGEFLVPLSTFWRPVATGEATVDPRSEEGRKKYTVHGSDALKHPVTRGRFLADGLKGLAEDGPGARHPSRHSRSGSRGPAS